MRRFATSLGLLAWLVAGGVPCAFPADDTSASAAGDPFASAVRPILASRCFGCHSGKAPEAGLDLSRFAGKGEVLPAFRLWEKVIQRSNPARCPPKTRGR
jgi:hypothetical protein